MRVSDLRSTWIYRGFHNEPAEVRDDAQKALSLIFAEAIFTFSVGEAGKTSGAIDWAGGGLDLMVTVDAAAGDEFPTFKIVGIGRPGTQTDGWEHDYNCPIGHQKHGNGPAGYVASLIAVKHT